MSERILRRPDVQDRTGLSRSGLYSAIKNGEFPAPVKLTTRAVGWPESFITKWIESRIQGKEATK
jgi:prophage regulatory protein